MSSDQVTDPQTSRPAAVDPEIASRLLPQVSFRLILAVVTLAALAALAGRRAGLGGAFAGAVLAVMAALLATFSGFAVLFLIAWVPAVLGRDRWSEVGKGNPFAEGQLPPQLLPPRDPTT